MAYIKLNRELINNPIYYDDKLLSFYVRLIMLCKVKSVKQNDINVARGQLLTTIRELAAVLNLRTTNTFKLLNLLEREQLITITKCARGSIITINNFDCLGDITKKCEQQKPCSREQNANKIGGSTLFYNNKKNVKNGVARACENQIFENQTEEPVIKNAVNSENSDEKKRALIENFPTRESLVAKYGEENVFEYECRFERWKNRQKKAVKISCCEAIERWMRDDKVEKKSAKASDEAAFDTDEIMRRVINNYNQ